MSDWLISLCTLVLPSITLTDSCIKLTMLNFIIRSKKRGFLPTLSELTNFHGKKKKELFNDERKISEVSEDELDISDMSTASSSTDTGETGSIYSSLVSCDKLS